MKRILSLLLSLMVIVSFVACGNNDDSSKVDSSSSTSDSIIIDREGNEVEVQEEITKIVSTSPATTEILVGLGLEENIVSADMFSADIEGLKDGVATLDMMNLDMEQIVALEPDVVFLNEISEQGVEDKYAPIKDAGIEVMFIPAANSLQGIMDDITFISKYTDTEEKGQELVTEIQDTIDLVKEKVADVSDTPTVYFEIGAAPYFYSFGKNTFLNEIIELCGGENIFADQEGWLPITEESIVEANPDIIISNVSYDGYSYTEIYDRDGWDVLNAVENEQVIYVDFNATSRASQNIVQGIKEIANAIHPGIVE